MSENGITYRVMTGDDEVEVRHVIKTCLLKQELILGSRECEWPRESEAWVGPTSSDSMKGGVAIVAVDATTNQIVGLRLSVIRTKDDPKNLIFPPDNPDTHKLSKVSDAYSILYDGIDLFQRYNVNTVIGFRGLCVIDGYKQRGIARKMVEKCLEVIAEKRISCVIQAEASSSYTKRIFDKLGFEALREIKYDDLIVDGKPYLKSPPEHPSWSAHVKVMVIQ